MLKKSTESTEGKYVIVSGITAIVACGFLVSGMVTDPTTAFEMASATEVSELYKAISILKETKAIDLGAIVTILTFIASLYKNFTNSRTELKGIAITEESKVRREAIKSAVPLREVPKPDNGDFPKAF